MKSEKLSKICQIINDKIDFKTLRNKSLRYISTENMIKDRGGITQNKNIPYRGKATFFKKGDILISNIRPYFKKIWHADCEGGCSQDVLVFRAFSGINSQFIYYCLSEEKFFDYVTQSAKGTKMPRGDKIKMLDFLIPLLPRKFQDKIAFFISRLDEKIRVNTQINDNLAA